MESQFAAYARKRWWFVTGGAVVALAIVVAVAASRDETTYSHTAHFVLHPDSRASVSDANNAVDVSAQDGPLVQTVRRVVSSSEMLRRAAFAAGVRDVSQLRSSASVSPGTAYFDAVVNAPTPAEAAKVGRAFEAIVPRYVETSYRGFAFDGLGSDASTERTFPPGTGVLVLALVLGAAAAVALLFVPFNLRARRVSAVTEARPVPEPEPAPGEPEIEPEPEAEPTPARTPAVARAKAKRRDSGSVPPNPVPAKGRQGRARAARWRTPAAT
jgi:hypothetical protein